MAENVAQATPPKKRKEVPRRKRGCGPRDHGERDRDQH
jgi:hypothetical protein